MEASGGGRGGGGGCLVEVVEKMSEELRDESRDILLWAMRVAFAFVEMLEAFSIEIFDDVMIMCWIIEIRQLVVEFEVIYCEGR